MHCNGKTLQLFSLSEKGTGREQINKSLPKEIKTALGQSKYEKFQQTIYEKRKEIKEKEWEASHKEKINKKWKKIRESLSTAKKDLEDLDNSDAPQREIEKAKAKIRTPEAKHNIKARHKYLSSFQAVSDKSNIEGDIQVLEDNQEEDLEEEKEENTSETLKAIREKRL